jgi:hypothetical protein
MNAAGSPQGDGTGIPRWLVIAFAAKLVLVVVIVGVVLWWTGR